MRARVKEARTRIPKESESRTSSVCLDEPIQEMRGLGRDDNRILPKKNQKQNLAKHAAEEESDSSDAPINFRAKKIPTGLTSKPSVKSPEERQQQDATLPSANEKEQLAPGG